MNRETIIVTGGSGLIGAALCHRLAGLYNIVAFDRAGPPDPPTSAVAISVDLTSEDSVRHGLERVREMFGNRIASVIHLAAFYDFSGEPSPLYDEVTVQGTRRLLRLLQSFEVEQFQFSSTLLVHAPTQPGRTINEDSPLEPKWEYPRSKVETEEVIARERGNIPALLLRIGGVYDEEGHSIPITQQMQRIHERQMVSHVYPGDLGHGQAFVHLDDVVEAIVAGLERRATLPAFLPLLIAEPQVMGYGELQTVFGRLIHGEEWTTREIPKALAKSGAWLQEKMPLGEKPFIKPWMIDLADDHFEVDISRARKFLGWEPRHTLRQTLPRMARSLKRSPLEFYEENGLNAPVRLLEQAPAAFWGLQANLFLAAWLISSPFTFGLPDPRLIWNDVVCGATVMLASLIGLRTRSPWPRWWQATVGLWLTLAPIVFWAPSAAVYNNDSLIGTLMFVFAAALPHWWIDRPSRSPSTPPGWSYNPSSWAQRLPIVGLALLGFFIARYMAAYQLEHTESVWDPFFGDGTRRILESEVSQKFPVSDAGLGAWSYLVDAMAGVLGGVRRWRRMPWLVLLFGLFIIPPGVTSIVLIMLQPISVGAWCSLCLITAIIMLCMVGPAADEVIASIQLLRRAHRSGGGFWKTLWRGPDAGQELPVNPVEKRPPSTAPSQRYSAVWTLLPAGLLGGWLMAAPEVFAIGGAAAKNHYLSGALVATFSIVALAEVTRTARWLNCLLGLWLVLSPWFLSGGGVGSRALCAAVGVAVVALSIRRGKVRHHYGTFDSWVR